MPKASVQFKLLWLASRNCASSFTSVQLHPKIRAGVQGVADLEFIQVMTLAIIPDYREMQVYTGG